MKHSIHQLSTALKARVFSMLALSLFNPFGVRASANADTPSAAAETQQADTSQQQLIHVASDADKEQYDFLLKLDENKDIVGFQCNGCDKKDYPIEEVQSGTVVIHKDKPIKVDVLTLKTDDADSRGPISVRMSYLVNAFKKGLRSEFAFELQRIGEKWIAYTNSDNGHRPFTQMFLKKNAPVGMTVGIAAVEVW